MKNMIARLFWEIRSSRKKMMALGKSNLCKPVIKHLYGLKICFMLSMIPVSMLVFGQVGIGTSTPHASAQLELNAANRGFLPTRIALTSVNDLTTISSPATGLLVFNTASAGTSPNNVTPGYYYFNGTRWVRFGWVTKLDDLDDARFDSIRSNLGIGTGTLASLITNPASWETKDNIAIGTLALNKNSTGATNLALGYSAIFNNTSGSGNLGIGNGALYNNTSGKYNTVIGHFSGNFGGIGNTAVGYEALGSWGGNYNTAVGAAALYNEVGPGEKNTLIGAQATIHDNAGPNIKNSSAIGYGALLWASNTVQLGNDSVVQVLTAGKIKGLGYLTTGTALTSATDVTTIASPDTGLIVYNKSNAGISPNNLTPGYYYFNGLKWSRLTGASKLDELEDARYDSVNENLFIGNTAKANNTGGFENVAIGSHAMVNNTSGAYNLAIGSRALENNLSGYKNVAIGRNALSGNLFGRFNLAIGTDVLKRCAGADNNLALGFGALSENGWGSQNIAIGNNSLYNNEGGTGNIAIGYGTAMNNVHGSGNIAIGMNTLLNNHSGNYNEAIGDVALSNNSTGTKNSAFGRGALLNNNSGSYNVAIGRESLIDNTNGSYNTAIGYQSNVSSGDFTNATAIGYGAIVQASNTIQLGNTSITNVYTSGNITANSVQLTSDARLKTNIEGIEGSLQTLLRLRPYSYQKRSGFEPGSHEDKEYGFLAQDIREILPELVKEGNDPDKALTVNYTALIPILTKAIQEQEDKIDKQQEQLLELQRQVSELREIIAGRTSMKTMKKKNIVEPNK